MSRAAPFAHRNLPLLLLRAREAVMQHRRPSLRAQGLSDQQWRVLRVLAEPAHAEGLDTGRLARESHLLGPSLTGMLTRMEAAGLVQRARSAEDARRSVVSATDEGLALAAALRAFAGIADDLDDVLLERDARLRTGLGAGAFASARAGLPRCCRCRHEWLFQNRG